MGEVFRARDTKLGRDVALKIMPPGLSGDPEREARFQREARALAALQHPNVASVYGFEEVDDVRFIIMELIEGADLTKRMGNGPVPVADVLTIARQIAAGLEAAHDSGIVHRDLKPANIMETVEGDVKILDFGLAQAWIGDEQNQVESSATPTITAAMTQMGAIMGTAAYMSPEQARGSNVDRRADIWAFGVILFEMLTGKQLFKGESVSDTLAAVLRDQLDWDLLPVDEAPELCRLIERCLERKAKQRLRDIGEARIFLQDGGANSSLLNFTLPESALAGESAPSAKSSWPKLAIMSFVCLALGAAIGWQFLAQSPPTQVVHAMIPPPTGLVYQLNDLYPGVPTLSPDGTMIAYSATNAENETFLYLRHIDEGVPMKLSDTEQTAYPFWSPDSKFIGFFDYNNKKLKKVAATGGSPITLCAAENGKGGSWNHEGTIVFAPTANSAIHMVKDIGGDPVPISKLDSSSNSYRHPRFLPDGHSYLFVARSNSNSRLNQIFIADLDTNIVPRVISPSESNAEYANGYLLTVKDGALMASAFTPDQPTVISGAVPLVDDILNLNGAAVAGFSVSPTGSLTFLTGTSSTSDEPLVWIDTATGQSTPMGQPGEYGGVSLSPDGKLAVLVVASGDRGESDLWLLDLETELMTRFTFSEGSEQRPVWSPDSDVLFYASTVDSLTQIIRQAIEGQGHSDVLYESVTMVFPSDVSPDGQHLILSSRSKNSKLQMNRLSLQNPDADLEILKSSATVSAGGGVYSPDGRWIAYNTESESGWDIFVMAAEGGNRVWQVTTEGTVYPKWAKDGTELWSTGFSGEVVQMAVDGSTNTFRVGGRSQTLTASVPDGDGTYYDLAPDNSRILVIGGVRNREVESSLLHYVNDWQSALAR
ncbi:MAG: protein kinase [Candidatus Krumholzibacteria bacterium]|nr:protein kinase [Candidatus Krumholzibacteria bacterium]